MTIFSRIIDGEIPCHRLYEDEQVLAILDIGPLSRGHALLIPKQQVSGVHELSDESAAAIGRVLPRLCRAIIEATGAEAYNVLANTGQSAGQEVMHVHFHIIPKMGDRGLGLVWKASELDPEEGRKLAEEISSRL